MKDQHKKVDPTISYVGWHCMIIDSYDMSKGKANANVCQVAGKKKKSDQPLKWKYDLKKVYTTQGLVMWSMLNLNILKKIDQATP